MVTITFKTTISDLDLQAIAKTQGYKAEVINDEKTYVNPQTDIEFATEFLSNKFQTTLEHEITYPQVNDLSPKDFAALKDTTLTTLKENSTISF